MRPSVRVGLGLASVAGVGALGYTFLFPKIGHASRAEIEGVLPKSLLARDAPRPDAESRLAEIALLGEGLPRQKSGATPASSPEAEGILAKVEALLARGPIRSSVRAGVFGNFSALKDAAKAMGAALAESRRRGDRAGSLRWGRLALRFAAAERDAGGAVIDGLVAIAIGAIAERAVYVAELDGAFDDQGRAALLALLPAGDGRSPRMAAAVRRDFRGYLLPALLDPKGHLKEIVGDGDAPLFEEEPRPQPPLAGTFDPLATARLAGGVYGALIDDLEAPYWKQRHGERAILASLGVGLPTPPTRPSGERVTEGLEAIRYRLAMNAGRNTLGRTLARSTVLTQLADASTREAANRNLLRSILLLRTGRSANELDPFDGKPLRIDRRRKIVWSVGVDGKDDGGAIGRGGEPGALDYGYPYEDHAFRPRSPGSSRPGSPPAR